MNKLTNCTFIGFKAGSKILDGNGIVIIGDGIKTLDTNQNNVIFINENIAIGKTVFGRINTLYEILGGK